MRSRPRLAAAALVVLGATLVLAPAAGADTSRAGSTLSVVDDVTPSGDGISVRVLGGDSFLEVAADPGTEVVVLGYQEEPYLRIGPDGTVEQNALSPAVGINSERLGGERDPDSDAAAEPRWVTIGGSGRVAWHDHRIHWMLPTDPVAAPDGVIQTWDVPLEVDGETRVITGRLLLEDAAFPWAAVVAGAIAVAVALLARGLRRQLGVVAFAAPVALALTLAWWVDNPPTARGFPWAILISAGATVGSLAGIAALVRGRPQLATRFMVAAVALLTGWWMGRAGVLWSPVVPTSWPPWTDRLGTAVVVGITIGTMASIVVESLNSGGTPRLRRRSPAPR